MPDVVSPFLRSLPLFQDPKYQPFRWEPAEGAKTRGAALLIHGLPGTPDDMRALGEVLRDDGWTVDAPLLPGFGPSIATLPERRYAEWVETVQRELSLLRREHDNVLLVGHSLGAAVSLLAVADEPPSGQVLLAPYWRFGGPMSHYLWPLMRLVVRRWRPLRKMDFDSPMVRDGLLRLIPDLNLDAGAVREELRAFVVPIELLNELRRLGIATKRAARRSPAPTLVIQGVRDTLVRPEYSRRLARTLPNVTGFELVDGSHTLTRPQDGAWERVSGLVRRFGRNLS